MELSDANIPAILVLSDLSKVFELAGPRKTASGKTELRLKHVTLKLSFYAAQVLSTPSRNLRRVADEVMARSKIMEGEAVPSQSDTVGRDLPSGLT
jgi:hypothetical protein